MRRVIHVLIVDDRTLMRELLADRLSREEGLHVEAVPTSDEALAWSRTSGPAVVLLSTAATGLGPFSAGRSIRDLNGEARLLFLSPAVRDVEIEQALQAGAHGYLTEQQSVEALAAAIRLVAGGESCFAPVIRSRLVETESGVRAVGAVRTVLSTLSDREREVLIHTAEGMSAKEIARLMHLSTRTVESHAARLMRKLGLRDRVALTRYAIREGLVSP